MEFSDISISKQQVIQPNELDSQDNYADIQHENYHCLDTPTISLSSETIQHGLLSSQYETSLCDEE